MRIPCRRLLVVTLLLSAATAGAAGCGSGSGGTGGATRLGDGNKLDQADMAQLGKLTWDDFEVPVMNVVQSKACN